MAIIFGSSERAILAHFTVGAKFVLNGDEYIILESGKPICPKGEPKTDIYVQALNTLSNTEIEIKISFKQHNADFLENKTNAERAELLLGYDWTDIIRKSTASIKEQFENRPLVYKSSYRRTEKGAICTAPLKLDTLELELECKNPKNWTWDRIRNPNTGQIEYLHDKLMSRKRGTYLSKIGESFHGTWTRRRPSGRRTQTEIRI